MQRGEQFELECLSYLNSKYKNDNNEFIHHKTSDSSGSDIEVFINGKSTFFIEIKDKTAQSGQFVVFADDNTQTFVFSKKNKSTPNELTDNIISYMNSYYQKFKDADTSGESINIDSTTFSKWIINHYKQKNVKYVMSRNKNIIIFPIEKFNDYFDISATYRIKKSGSKSTPIKNMDATINYIRENFNVTNLYKQLIPRKNKLFAETNSNFDNFQFSLGDNVYIFSKQETPHLYEIRILSDIANKNVIFKIRLKQDQLPSDLIQFESEFL